MNRLPLLSAAALLLAAAAGMGAGAAPAQAQEPDYLLYGGRDHTIFLGCLNCSRFDSDSVWNKAGAYGSEHDRSTIWSKASPYGSPYNALSPWHPHSTDAPVVRDRNGKSYGKFTRNVFDGARTDVDALLWILDNYDSIIADLDSARQRY
ncbi:hypothetical protein [Pelagibius sp.]|uniref:hypothetical protein n=1 Tax=Pelagibius sp. TaxID=1931238 RepID=UPI003B50B9D5